MSATATPSPNAMNPVSGTSPLRIVLFGMPDAGKSSLLGALAQAAQLQNRTLHGRLIDLSHGLVELQRRLYDDRQTETRQEIVPYPVVYEPYRDGTDVSARFDAVLYDCDGRVANELLSQKKTLDTRVKAGSLAQAVLNADALILTIDASARNEQIEDDFREFFRFLRLLETHRGHSRSVGGLPVYLALTKCDLLARNRMPRKEWEAKIEARRQQVRERFARYLEGNASPQSPLLSFGSLELHVTPTAVKRPELSETAAHPREPLGVAELFRDCFGSANEFRRRIESANRRLKWTLASVGGFIAVAASVALFLITTGGPVEKPLALIERVEMLQARDKPLPDRLAYELLQKRYDELIALRNDPDFQNLPDDKKNFIRGRIDELLAYQEFVERLTRIPLPERARTLADLTHIENDLSKQAAVPASYEKDWVQTEAVLERQRRFSEIESIRAGVEELRTFFTSLKSRADNLLFEKDFHASWKPQADSVFDHEKALPFPRGEGARSVAYEFDETLAVEKDWLRARLKLETMRDLAAALGLVGDPASAVLELPPILPAADLNRFADSRLKQLRQIYPASGKWSLAALPDPLQQELRRKLQRSLDQLTLYGQQAIRARLREGRPPGDDSPRDWREIAEWLTSPAMLPTRELFAFVAQLLDPGAEDPVGATAAFLRKPSFEIQIKALMLSVPNNLPQGPFAPGEELLVFLRPQGATSARSTLTFRIDRAATMEGVRDKQYRYKLAEGEGKLTFRPLDEFGAELNLKKGDKIWQFIWSNARTASYAFESLNRAPYLTAASAERGSAADGVALTIDGKFPAVPALLPDVRRDKK